MYDLNRWPYADDAVECIRDAQRFLLHRERPRAILDSTHEVYRSGGQVDWKTVLDDLGIASGRLGISPYTAHLALLVHLLDEAERRYRSHGLSDDIFHDSFDDLRVKCEECFRVYGTYGTFVALWITRFHDMRCFGFGRLEAEVVPFRPDGSPVINIHIPSKGRLVESECRASYQKAVESGNIGFLLVTIIALITSVLTLASFVKVSHSVFFGQLPPELENVKEVSWGMRLAMGIFALLCIITGLFPSLVTTYLTEPAAAAVFNVKQYIEAMGFDGSAAAALEGGSFQYVGAWDPVSWLLVLCIALLAITIVAMAGKYDNASRCKAAVAEDKYQLFYGGEKQEFSQLGGDDLFWGFKHNWRAYFDYMHRLHSGIVNDYALWAVVDLALVTLFSLIVL